MQNWSRDLCYLSSCRRLTYDDAVSVLRQHSDQFQNEASVSCMDAVNAFLYLYINYVNYV